MIEVSPEEQRWKSMLAENDNLRDFNKFIVPAMKTHGEAFKLMAATEARNRGYKADRAAGVYVMAQRLNLRLTKGRNIIRVDWQDGTLYVEFANSPKVYEYPDCPEVWCINLLKSPYPDHLWAGYKSKIDARAQKEAPPSQLALDGARGR
jgi:phage terminase large subunit-like protein